jgi:hypothetical protein
LLFYDPFSQLLNKFSLLRASTKDDQKQKKDQLAFGNALWFLEWIYWTFAVPCFARKLLFWWVLMLLWKEHREGRKFIGF